MKVAIVMGSDSDLAVMRSACDTLVEFGVSFDVRVISAHRTPAIATEFAASAQAEGYGTIIAAAGGAAHLAGVLAAHTMLPVIGVPILGSSFNGMDSLLSMVQMPSGIPVAVVSVNGAKNAALLSIQMLSIADEHLRDKLVAHRKKQCEEVQEKDARLQDRGYRDY